MIDLTNINFPKPILKWVGGKTQILDKIISIYPTQINNYHEVFLGGGSVLLAFLELVRNKKINITGTINAYDLNLVSNLNLLSLTSAITFYNKWFIFYGSANGVANSLISQ